MGFPKVGHLPFLVDSVVLRPNRYRQQYEGNELFLGMTQQSRSRANDAVRSYPGFPSARSSASISSRKRCNSSFAKSNADAARAL